MIQIHEIRVEMKDTRDVVLVVFVVGIHYISVLEIGCNFEQYLNYRECITQGFSNGGLYTPVDTSGGLP